MWVNMRNLVAINSAYVAGLLLAHLSGPAGYDIGPWWAGLVASPFLFVAYTLRPLNESKQNRR